MKLKMLNLPFNKSVKDPKIVNKRKIKAITDNQ